MIEAASRSAQCIGRMTATSDRVVKLERNMVRDVVLDRPERRDDT
jgi:hypothetical protein